MTRKEMYNKMTTLNGYGVVKRFKDGTKNYYFYEVFEDSTYKDTMNRILSHNINPENDLILRYFQDSNTIFAVEKVYTVSDEYAKEYNLWYKDRIKMYLFDAPVDYTGCKEYDCAFCY